MASGDKLSPPLLTPEEIKRLEAKRWREFRRSQEAWHRQHGALQPDPAARERFEAERREAVKPLARVGIPADRQAWRIKAQVQRLDRLSHRRLLPAAPLTRSRESRPRQRVASSPRKARAPDDEDPEPPELRGTAA